MLWMGLSSSPSESKYALDNPVHFMNWAVFSGFSASTFIGMTRIFLFRLDSSNCTSFVDTDRQEMHQWAKKSRTRIWLSLIALIWSSFCQTWRARMPSPISECFDSVPASVPTRMALRASIADLTELKTLTDMLRIQPPGFLFQFPCLVRFAKWRCFLVNCQSCRRISYWFSTPTLVHVLE